MAPPAHDDWEQIRRWRQTRRTALIDARIHAGGKRRREWAQAIMPRVNSILADLEPGIVGFYWPFKGEFDARGLVRELLEQGWRAALPAVIEPRTPLEFRHWAPDTRLVPGVWKIPMPEERHLLAPTLLLVPLVGFDPGRYRLGYGGGYYDRTLASLTPRPLTLGIGYERCRLGTIFPQPHDIRMDIVVTEAATRRSP
ncbi:MAG: 5-formyltetrahydrofolate cyclo-ligase [Chromatiales bacterium]